jgi:hypothetical protein
MMLRASKRWFLEHDDKNRCIGVSGWQPPIREWQPPDFLSVAELSNSSRMACRCSANRLARASHSPTFLQSYHRGRGTGARPLCLSRLDAVRCGVHSYQTGITEHVLDRELLARELSVILDHGLLQRWKICGKEGVVVSTSGVHVLLISRFDLASHNELQKSQRRLFAISAFDI